MSAPHPPAQTVRTEEECPSARTHAIPFDFQGGMT